MNSSPEHFYTSEIPGFSANASGRMERIDASALERLRTERDRMLREIEEDLSPGFLEAIRSKIAYETRALRSLLEREQKSQIHTDESRGVLRLEYFIRRPLPPSQF